MSRPPCCARASSAAGTIACLAVAAAEASSLVYFKQNNAWLSGRQGGGHARPQRRAEAEARARPGGLAYQRQREREYVLAADLRLERLTLHDCRHTAASLMIAAGVNAKSLSTYLGHASIVETYDRYGHLMPGNETEAAGLMDDYLSAASG